MATAVAVAVFFLFPSAFFDSLHECRSIRNSFILLQFDFTLLTEFFKTRSRSNAELHSLRLRLSYGQNHAKATLNFLF